MLNNHFGNFEENREVILNISGLNACGDACFFAVAHFLGNELECLVEVGLEH